MGACSREILHGARPIMANQIKEKAVTHGFTPGLGSLMKACWESDPRKRPVANVLVSKFEEQVSILASGDSGM